MLSGLRDAISIVVDQRTKDYRERALVTFFGMNFIYLQCTLYYPTGVADPDVPAFRLQKVEKSSS